LARLPRNFHPFAFDNQDSMTILARARLPALARRETAGSAFEPLRDHGLAWREKIAGAKTAIYGSF
jgi:hypothetical protein